MISVRPCTAAEALEHPWFKIEQGAHQGGMRPLHLSESQDDLKKYQKMYEKLKVGTVSLVG